MQVLYLMKKDILLAGNYLYFCVLVFIGVPVFFSLQSIHMSSVYVLLVSFSFSCYFLFSNIFSMEDKYKGNLYLMAIPYKKSTIVIAKYVLALLLFAIEAVFYEILSRMTVAGSHLLKGLTFTSVSLVFFFLAVVLGVFFPIYFRYSYTKIKYALLLVMIFLPTWGSAGLAALAGKKIVSEAPSISAGALTGLILLSIVILSVSTKISTRFLKKRDF